MTLKDLIASAKIDSEDAENQAIVAMLTPKTRQESGKSFQEALGYNPITVFDEMEMGEILDAYSESSKVVGARKNDIITYAMSSIETSRTKRQVDALAEAIKEITDDGEYDDFVIWAASRYPEPDDDDDDELEEFEEFPSEDIESLLDQDDDDDD